MSAVLNLQSRPVRPNLSVVQNQRTMPVARTRGKLGFSATLLVGSFVIALLNLGLNIVTSTGVYQVASLKQERAQLDLSTQIVAQKVDSLSSNQNLASAAQAMGMVANANPVFLDLSNQKVYGSPSAATQNISRRVSGNLVANAEWSTKTSPNRIRAALAAEQAKATQPVAASVATVQSATTSKTKPGASIGTGSNLGAGYVGGAKSSTSQVGLANSGIPTAPTH